MEIYNFDNMASLDKKSLELVWIAYNKNTPNDYILEIGFNMNSGYVYIALENGISIASCFGQSVDYIVYDYETGDEFFLDTYEEAETKLEKLNERV